MSDCQKTQLPQVSYWMTTSKLSTSGATDSAPEECKVWVIYYKQHHQPLHTCDV